MRQDAEADAVLQTYGFAQYQVELSTWDPADRKTYMGSDADWELANHSLENAMKRKTRPLPAGFDSC